ncbi:MAG TPA: response regulator [Polyangiaceae bacterium]|jgi:DNA-binding NarL/FixJ family response regulator
MKVLIIDDSMIVRDRLTEALRELGSVDEMRGVADVSGALLALHELAPDLVILDLHLAGGSGFDVLPHLKKREPRPLIVVLTNHAGVEYADRCRQLGADYFFDKSAEYERALEVIQLAHPRMDRAVGQMPTE